jgi:hypothetical protein
MEIIRVPNVAKIEEIAINSAVDIPCFAFSDLLGTKTSDRGVTLGYDLKKRNFFTPSAFPSG